MSGPLRTTLAFAVLLGPAVLWFGHFMFVYGAVSLDIVLQQHAGAPSRIVMGIATLLALPLNLLAWMLVPRLAPEDRDTRRFWIVSTRLLAITSSVAILYQAAPALLVR